MQEEIVDETDEFVDVHKRYALVLFCWQFVVPVSMYHEKLYNDMAFSQDTSGCCRRCRFFSCSGSIFKKVDRTEGSSESLPSTFQFCMPILALDNQQKSQDQLFHLSEQILLFSDIQIINHGSLHDRTSIKSRNDA